MEQKEIITAVLVIVLVSVILFAGPLSKRLNQEETYELGALPSADVRMKNPASQCLPQTCLGLNQKCGQINDGCGNILNCGTCPSGKVCWGGTCLDPGTCGNNLDCGLNEPAGDPFCQGNTIYQDVKIYECSQQVTFSTAWIPGAVCTNQVKRVKLHQCPDGTSCQNGLCYNPCTSDSECTIPDPQTDRRTNLQVACVNGFCDAPNALASTQYGYCIDSDGTPDNPSVHDTSIQIPGYIVLLRPKSAGATYLFDNCDMSSPTVLTNNQKEWKCSGDNEFITYCPSIIPSFNCLIYRSSAFNQYVPYAVNVGVCS